MAGFTVMIPHYGESEPQRSPECGEPPLHLRVLWEIGIGAESQLFRAQPLHTARLQEDTWKDRSIRVRSCDLHIFQRWPSHFRYALVTHHGLSIVNFVFIAHELHDIVPKIRPRPVDPVLLPEVKPQNPARETEWDFLVSVLGADQTSRVLEALLNSNCDAKQ